MNIKFIKANGRISRNRRSVKGISKKVDNKLLIVFLLCCIFFIGVFLGTAYLKSEMYAKSFEVYENVLNKENLIEFGPKKKEIFIDSVCQNIIILIFFWIIGLSIVGVPLLIFFIFFEGVSIGITISYVLLMLGFYEGYSFIYISMYITTILNVFSMIILCYSAIKVTFNVFRKSRDIKSEFIRHSAVCILVLIMLIFSSFIEVYMGEIGKNFILS